MNVKEAEKALGDWYSKGCIGNIIFHKMPDKADIGCFVEQVIKVREMDGKTRTLVNDIHTTLSFDKAEIFLKDGSPDRVKITRGV